ncbi:kelch-like protein 24 [Branchiostoma floridae]|uniref:Kelch-like protein 24 n=2 Tax=Branchiostoma floridae TaxID=7739 RepID=A0A9J7LJX9_BRAFL|nr:kelch-like protein 24 [Branchiostoma floridae]
MAEAEPLDYNSDLGCYVRMEDRTSHEDDCSHYKYISQCDKVLAQLNSQRHCGDFLDLVVKVQDMEFPCHRAVLASTPYFKVMFSSDFTERRSKVVQLHEIDSDGFSKILDFLYTGEIRISKDDVHNILQAAHMLQIDKITEYCRAFIKENYDLSNCLSAMRLSDLYGFSDLREQARKDTLSNFSEVSQSEEFLTLSGQELLDLLTDKKLQVSGEENIVDAVIRWLDHDQENRRTAIVSIFQEIHLMSVRVSTLKKLEMHPVIQDSPECLAKVTAVKEKHLDGTSIGAELEEAKFRQRLGTSDDLVLLVGGGMITEGSMAMGDYYAAYTTPLQSVMCLDPDTEQYYHVTALPMHITGYMSVTSGERCLYVTGGRAHPFCVYDPGSVPLRQAFRYDFVTNCWTKLPDMPRGRAGHQSVVVDGKLFLVGGDTDDTSAFSMDRYDLKEEAWIEPPTLPEIASLDLTVTSCNGKIVLVELFDDTENACSWVEETKLLVHVFDVKATHWSYSDIPVLCSRLESVCKLVTVVHGNVHILLNLRDLYSPHMFLYDVELGTLSKLEDIGDLSVSFWGTQYQEEHTIHQEDLADTIICYKFDEDNDNISGSRETDITRTWDLTFELVGHSFLATSKCSIGWYCRDLYKLEH